MIVFILGAPISGKTTIRNELFKKCECLDIYDFQKNAKGFDELEKAEEKWINTAKEKIINKNDADILVLEHCLSNKNRRRTYLKEIKEITDEEIICLFVEPEKEIRYELVRKKLSVYEDVDIHDISNGVLNMNGWYEDCDRITKDEGFDSVLKVVPIWEDSVYD